MYTMSHPLKSQLEHTGNENLLPCQHAHSRTAAYVSRAKTIMHVVFLG